MHSHAAATSSDGSCSSAREQSSSLLLPPLLLLLLPELLLPRSASAAGIAGRSQDRHEPRGPAFHFILCTFIAGRTLSFRSVEFGLRRNVTDRACREAMETKAISQQPTLLPSFGYFAEPGTAAHAWHYGGVGGVASGVEQQDVVLSVSADFDKDVLGQYIHKIYCRDCCRSAEERQQQQQQQQHGSDASQGQRANGSSVPSTLTTGGGAASSKHNWDQQQEEDEAHDAAERRRQQQLDGSGATAAAASALSPTGSLLLSSLFPMDATNATTAAFVGLDKEKNKESLKRKLLLRRSAGELPLDQEKRLPQKSPPLFAQQRKHLQRAQNTTNHRRTVNHEGCSLRWPVGIDSVMPQQAALETEASPAKRPRAASRCDSGGKEQSTEQLFTSATDVLGDPTSFGERLLARSEVETPHTHSPIEGGCIASGFTGESQFSSERLLGCDVAPMQGYDGSGIECADDGSTCLRLEIVDASGCSSNSKYLERSDNYSIGGSHSCCNIRPDGTAAMDSPDDPQLQLTASSTSSQQHGWQEGSPSLGTDAESCCLADGEHCCNQKADSAAASVTDASATAGTTTSSGMHMIAATAAHAASSGGAIMPATSSLKLHGTKTSSSLSCSNVGSSSSSSSSSSNSSKKAKPKAHTKTKVIKFHEYKGPPQQSTTSSAAKVAVGHPSVTSAATVRPGAAGVAATSAILPSANRAAAATAASSPTAASTSDSPQATAASATAAGAVATAIATGAVSAASGNESSTTAESTCSAINAEMARYHLMLRQQQLFLQWQLEVQQKSMPLLVPMVQTPPTPSPPPSSSRHAGAAVVIAAASAVQTPCTPAQRSAATSPGAATAADVASAFAQLHAEGQQPKVDSLSNHMESTQVPGSSATSSGASCNPSSNCSATLPSVHAQSVGDISSIAVPATSAADSTPSEYIAMPSIRIIQDSVPQASCMGPAQGMPVQLLSQQQLLPPLPSHNCKDDAANRMQPNSLEDMKIVELKAELKQRGLPVSGSKQQLIKRLLQSQQQQQQQNDGSALAAVPTGAVAASASASCSPLSAPSSLSLTSPPSTPPGLSSHCDDGYLQMLSISTASSSSSLAATEEEERTSQQQQQQQHQNRGNCTAFISASATVHEEIVRQQQRQIEELQKMLHESRLQLSTQQLQTGAGNRKDRRSPKKPSVKSGGATAVTSAGGTSRGSAAGPQQQRPGRVAEDAAGSSGGGSSGRATPAASHHRQSTRSPAATAASVRLPSTMPVLHRTPAVYTAYSPGHHVQASLTAAVLSPSASSTSPSTSLSEHFTGSTDELPCLALGQSAGISTVPVGLPPHDLDSMVLSTVAAGSDTANAVVAATTAAAVDTLNCEEIPSGGSPCSATSSDEFKVNARTQVDAPPTATTMDDVLEMLIAATPDLIESMSDPGEGTADHSSMPQGARLSAETLIVSADAQCYTLASHMPSSSLSGDGRHRFEQQCGRVGGILSQQATSTVSTVDAAEIVAASQRAASPTPTDWSELVGGSYFHLDDDDDCRSASAFNRFGNSCGVDGETDSSCDGCRADRGREPEDADARRLRHIDDTTSTSLSLDDFDANLNALEFKDEGGGCSSSSAGTLDWLDVVMHQQGSISATTSGSAAGLFPLGFQSDPLLTSHPAASMADLFTMDDADFGMLSEFGCGISWEKLHEVTTA